jgi:hypothetical protein
MSTHDPLRQPNEGPRPRTTEEGAASPLLPQSERFWGIVDSRVVVKAGSLDELVGRLEEMGMDRSELEVWEGDPESGKVAYSWSCRRVAPERAGHLSERALYGSNAVALRNAELARRINQEARANPQSPYAGKFVGLLNGQVVVVADDLDEVDRRLRELSADNKAMFIVEASRDYDEVMDIG